MATHACKFYEITTEKKFAHSFMRELMLLGFFEAEEAETPIDVKSMKEKYDRVVSQRQVLENALEAMGKEVPKKQLPKAGGELTPKSLSKLLKDKDALFKIAQSVQLSASRLADIRTEEAEVALDIAAIEGYKTIDIDVFQDFDLLTVRAFRVKTVVSEKIRKEVIDLDLGEYVEVHTLGGDEVVSVFVGLKDKEEEIDTLLGEREIVPIRRSTSSSMTSPKASYADLKKTMEKLKKEHGELDKSIFSHCKASFSDLGMLYDVLNLEGDAYDALKYVGMPVVTGEDVDHNDDAMVVIKGWMDSDKLKKIQKSLVAIDPQMNIEEFLKDDHEDVRSIQKNNILVRPFQIISGLQGVPRPGELDPAMITAPFFLAFFGFALGDAGYGIILVLLSSFLLFVKKVKGQMQDAMLLILYSGIATIIVGALLGGWFGVDVSPTAEGLNLDNSLIKFLHNFATLSLTGSVIAVLGGSMAIGFLQQLIGLVLDIVNKARAKQLGKGLWMSGTWILLFITVGFAYFLAPKVDTLSFIADNPLPLVLGVGFLFAWGQGYNTKNLIIRPIAGIMGSLLEATGWLSNTLSYARLLALGLATGIIAGVVNMMAGMAGNTESIIGIILFVTVLVIGHTFNLLMNVLGSGINVARLHLVEFYPKFFLAEGTPLVPLSIKSSKSSFREDISHTDFVK